MIKCETHLVECLRGIKVEPTASCKSEFNSSFVKDYSLIYDTNNYYASEQTEPGQWWSIDLHRNVVLSSYQIKAGTGCRWLYHWKILVSTNKRYWKNISEHTGYPNDTMFEVNYRRSFRHIKIEGNNACDAKLAFYYIKLYGSFNPSPNIESNYVMRPKINPLIIIFQTITM